MADVILALGSNYSGQDAAAGGDGMATAFLEFGCAQIKERVGAIARRSSLYGSLAVGPACQPDYVNQVILVETGLSPRRLLTKLKLIEQAAGRRGGLLWGPRPLDIDIIDYGGLVLNWPGAARRLDKLLLKPAKVRPLTLPHGAAHSRAFVLKPLAEILPRWRHPVFGLQAAPLMQLTCSPLVIKATEKLEKAL